MKRNILEEALEFQENKHTYSPAEQKRIKKTLLKEIEVTRKKVSESFLHYIESINKL